MTRITSPTPFAPLPDDDALRHPDTGHVLLATLEQGRRVERLSLWLSLAAIAFLAASVARAPDVADWVRAWRNPPAAALWLSLFAGLAQCYYALRVRLDARLFARLYARPIVDSLDLRRLDEGLALLGAPKSEPPRVLRARWNGALRLLRRQLIGCAAQAVCLLGAGIWVWIVR